MVNRDINIGEDVLQHHGVKGMKWGIRRYQKKDGTLTNAGKKKRRSVDYENKQIKADRKNDLKNVRKLSDADLRKKIERLKMEKQFKDLTTEDVAPGRKYVSDIMSSSGKKVATAFVTGAALYGTKAAMTKQFDIREMASYMTPKPKNK